MTRPKLVIFDCDGVLVDSEGATNEVLAKNLSNYGPTLSQQECIDNFVGGTMAGLADKARGLGYDLPDDWLDEIYAAMFERLAEGVPVIEGVVDVLDALDRSDIPYCVGSNGPMEKMDITLVNAGLMDRLKGRIYSPHVIGMEHAKPAPGLYLHAARTMGFAPADCAVIEDSASGAKGAQAAGIRCFGYTGETPADVLEAVGAVTFASMHGLPELLEL